MSFLLGQTEHPPTHLWRREDNGNGNKQMLVVYTVLTRTVFFPLHTGQVSLYMPPCWLYKAYKMFQHSTFPQRRKEKNIQSQLVVCILACQFLLTYSYVCRQYSLVHGEGPDVKVVDRCHPLHCYQTVPHLTVSHSCWST